MLWLLNSNIRTMTDHTPQSILELGSHDTIRMSAPCPDHGRELQDGTWKGRKSSKYMTTQWDFEGKRWYVFHCTEKGGHLFNALPPRGGVPQTWIEVKDWVAKEKLRIAGLKTGKKKGLQDGYGSTA